MMIIGCDFHTHCQQTAMPDEATGELSERRLDHQTGQPDAFYRNLQGPVRVGLKPPGRFAGSNTCWVRQPSGRPFNATSTNAVEFPGAASLRSLEGAGLAATLSTTANCNRKLSRPGSSLPSTSVPAHSRALNYRRLVLEWEHAFIEAHSPGALGSKSIRMDVKDLLRCPSAD